MKKLLLLLGLTLFLTGCQTLPTQPSYLVDGKPIGNHYMTWPAREKQLYGLTAWTASGSLAARNQIKGGWSASFHWEQEQPRTYELALFGPLGMNPIQIQGTPTQVTLKTSKQTLTAENPEVLMQHALGWQLPVSNLTYWLRGLPVPRVPEGHAVDMNNHIVHLKQEGWNVQYLRYVSIHGVDLPDRILLINPPWIAHIVIQHWQLNS